MDKMIVTVFNDEKSAYEGIKALRKLHDECSITLYAAAVISKDPKGKISVKQEADQGAFGTVLGFATGSLIGLLGGPVGLAAGIATGTIAGSLYDIVHLGVGDSFLAEASKQLTPGKMAVVAEIDEEWVTPLDTRMEHLGGVVIRRARGEFIDAQIEREIAADKAEFAKLKVECEQAVGETKAKLQAKIETSHNRLQAKRDQLYDRIEAVKQEGEARINLLHDQAAKARSDMKTKLEKRLDEARTDHKTRVDKLSKAWQLIKEAGSI